MNRIFANKLREKFLTEVDDTGNPTVQQQNNINEPNNTNAPVKPTTMASDPQQGTFLDSLEKMQNDIKAKRINITDTQAKMYFKSALMIFRSLGFMQSGFSDNHIQQIAMGQTSLTTAHLTNIPGKRIAFTMVYFPVRTFFLLKGRLPDMASIKQRAMVVLQNQTKPIANQNNNPTNELGSENNTI